MGLGSKFKVRGYRAVNPKPCSVSGLRRRVLRFCGLRVWAFRRSDVDSLL